MPLRSIWPPARILQESAGRLLGGTMQVEYLLWLSNIEEEAPEVLFTNSLSNQRQLALFTVSMNTTRLESFQHGTRILSD